MSMLQILLLIAHTYIPYILANSLALDLCVNFTVLLIFFSSYIKKLKINYVLLFFVSILSDGLYGFFWGYTGMLYALCILGVSAKHRLFIGLKFFSIFLIFIIAMFVQLLICIFAEAISDGNIYYMDIKNTLLIIVLYPLFHNFYASRYMTHLFSKES